MSTRSSFVMLNRALGQVNDGSDSGRGSPQKPTRFLLPPPEYPTAPNLPPHVLSEQFDLVNSDIRPNFIAKTLPVDTHLNVSAWQSFREVIDPLDETLVDQIVYGFTMGINREHHISIPFTNHRSARVNYSDVDSFVMKHCATGAILGPYDCNPLSVPIHPSPLQVAVSNSGKHRCVIDMSYPPQTSINSAIPTEWTQVPGFKGEFKLPTHDRICTHVLSTPEPHMFVADLAGYYMQIASDLSDAPYMCFCWRDKVFIHRRLPFGCRTACLQAQRVSNAVAAVHKSRSPGELEPYVDDFDAVCTASLSAKTYIEFHDLLRILGLLATPEKDIPPTVLAIFCGLEYDLVNYTLTLPEEKTLRAIAMFESWLQKDECSKQQLQALLGFLNHISTVVHAGRAFCASLIDILRDDQFPHPVSEDLKQDINTWLGFMHTKHSLKSIMKSQDLVTPDTTLAIAVYQNKAVFRISGHYVGIRVLSHHKLTTPIMFVMALWYICNTYMSHLQNQLILICVPTRAVSAAVNRAKVDAPFARQFLREMWMAQANNDAVVRAVYRKGYNNNEFFSQFVEFNTIYV